MTAVDSSSVRNYLLGLQERITSALEQVEGPQGARFVRDAWAKGPQERLQGDGITKNLGRWPHLGAGRLRLFPRARAAAAAFGHPAPPRVGRCAL